jgi:hypothetical protein
MPSTTSSEGASARPRTDGYCVAQLCHPSNRSNVQDRIRNARQGEGPTLFDEIVEIIRDHGAGGEESGDGIVLELM